MFSFLLSVQGLQVDDEIVEFGSVNVHNFQNLQNIATVVQHSEGVSLLLLKRFSCLSLLVTCSLFCGSSVLDSVCTVVALFPHSTELIPAWTTEQ